MRCVASLAIALGCGPVVATGDDAAGGSESTTGGVSTTASASITVGSTASTSTGATTVTTVDPDPSATQGEASSNVSLTAPDTLDPDGGTGPIECDQFMQDCPRGQKCMPWANDGGNSWNATRCTLIADDPGQPGEPCTVVGSGVSGIDDCDIASMCWNVDPDTLMGTCVPFCMGSEADPSCVSACDTCSIANEGVLILCLPGCDPLAPGCGRGEVCVPVNDRFACAPDAGGDTGALGEPCEYVNVCDPGLFCADPDTVPGCVDATGCCAPFCDAATADVCDTVLPGTVCVPWYDEGQQPEGCNASLIGACLLPA